jgi:hypothetical protein
LLQNAHWTGQERKNELKRDLDRGVQRGREEAEHARTRMEGSDTEVATGYEPTASPASRPHHER